MTESIHRIIENGHNVSSRIFYPFAQQQKFRQLFGSVSPCAHIILRPSLVTNGYKFANKGIFSCFLKKWPQAHKVHCKLAKYIALVIASWVTKCLPLGTVETISITTWHSLMKIKAFNKASSTSVYLFTNNNINKIKLTDFFGSQRLLPKCYLPYKPN
jgi:hypothetical protein